MVSSMDVRLLDRTLGGGSWYREQSQWSPLSARDHVSLQSTVPGHFCRPFLVAQLRAFPLPVVVLHPTRYFGSHIQTGYTCFVHNHPSILFPQPW